MAIIGGKGKGGGQQPASGGSSGKSEPYTMEDWRKDREKNKKEAEDFEQFAEENEVGKKDDGKSNSR